MNKGQTLILSWNRGLSLNTNTKTHKTNRLRNVFLILKVINVKYVVKKDLPCS